MKRYDTGVQAAKRQVDDLIESGRYGRLLLVRFYDFAKSYAHKPPVHKRPEESRPSRLPTWPLSPEWVPEEYEDAYAWFVNAASHDINLIRYFMGDELEARVRRRSHFGRHVHRLPRRRCFAGVRTGKE